MPPCARSCREVGDALAQTHAALRALLGHHGALRPFDYAEFEALAMSCDLEGDPIAVYPGTGQIAGDPKAALVEHVSAEHRDTLDEDVIQHRIAP